MPDRPAARTHRRALNRRRAHMSAPGVVASTEATISLADGRDGGSIKRLS